MRKLDQELTKFKVQLGPEWQKLHTAKWRRPKWIKFPRSMLEDARWARLSPQAAKAWLSILVIASESDNLELPPPDLLFIRLRSIGDVQKRTTFAALIDELIQCRFLLKTTPELQSIRVSEYQSYRDTNKKERASPACEASRGFASLALEITQDKRWGEEGRGGNHHHLGQPKQPQPASLVEQIFGGAAAKPMRVDYAAALGSFRPPAQSNRRCSAFLTMTEYLARLVPELGAEIG